MQTPDSIATDPTQNRLLAALPPAELARWLPHLEPVTVSHGLTMCDPNRPGHHVWFPTTALISLLHTTRTGDAIEIGVVGNDGVVGLSACTGTPTMSSQSVVQVAGQCLRIHARVVQEEFARGGAVTRGLLEYSQALVAQVAQTALCNRYHSIDMQLSRRLLVGLDRSPTAELMVTQEQLARMLGVRREGVATAASKLRKAGAIRYTRGRIVVMDRRQLEEISCECYLAATHEPYRVLAAAARARLGTPSSLASTPELDKVVVAGPAVGDTRNRRPIICLGAREMQ